MASSATNRYRVETNETAHEARSVLYHLVDEMDGLRATVAPFAGAEIASIQTRTPGGWLEILDRAEDYSKCDRWRGRAPWLWPAVGRSYSPVKLQRALETGDELTEFEWDHAGKTYPMPIHGFVMNREWKVLEARSDENAASMQCSFEDDEQTRCCFPFRFRLQITFYLSDGLLRAIFRIEAHKENVTPMPFCIGNHITIRAPLTERGRFEDVRIFAPVRRVHHVTNLGLVENCAEMSFREGIPLSDARLHNLIVGYFAREQATVRVVDPSGMEIEIGQRELDTTPASKTPTDALYFVFYANLRNRFFCPEPWLGLPNALNSGHPIILLSASEVFEWEMTVRVVKPTP